MLLKPTFWLWWWLDLLFLNGRWITISGLLSILSRRFIWFYFGRILGRIFIYFDWLFVEERLVATYCLETCGCKHDILVIKIKNGVKVLEKMGSKYYFITLKSIIESKIDLTFEFRRKRCGKVASRIYLNCYVWIETKRKIWKCIDDIVAILINFDGCDFNTSY